MYACMCVCGILCVCIICVFVGCVLRRKHTHTQTDARCAHAQYTTHIHIMHAICTTRRNKHLPTHTTHIHVHIDARYARQDVIKHLPKWLRGSVGVYRTVHDAASSLSKVSSLSLYVCVCMCVCVYVCVCISLVSAYRAVHDASSLSKVCPLSLCVCMCEFISLGVYRTVHDAVSSLSLSLCVCV